MTKEGYQAATVLGRGFFDYHISNLHPQTNTLDFKQGEDIVIQFNSAEKLSGIKCSNLRTRKPVDCQVEQEEDIYRIVLKTDRLRSGDYAFWQQGKPMFFYKFQLR